MNQTRSLYERDLTRGNTVRLFGGLSVAFTVAVAFPAILALLNLVSWIITVMIWILLFAVALFTVFTAFLSEGFRNAWGWALHISEYSTTFFAAVLRAYVYLMPVFAVLSVAFGVLAIIFGKKYEGLPGAKSGLSCGVTSIILTALGAIAYAILMAFGFGGIA